ncbi:acylphosphatase-2 [Peromyscus leucopus]|uniref:acylphosphatase-2 n=1 Tax=Peromyscus leucopus TaxID=10041 RepID=UPI0018850B05|nr:acylphosphatase-2 [Peromyscus leucopus]
MSLLRAAAAPAPRSLLRAAAAPALHTPLRLLARRLAAMAEPLKSVDYEVFGRVQGTSRPREAGTGLWEGREEASALRLRYTEGEAKKRGVVGWVKNTSKGTVTGQVQGPEEKVDSMKAWLSKVGSPSSRIDRTDFSNEKTISKLEYSNFSIRY